MLTSTPLPQANAYAMIGRRAAVAGIATKIGNHTFRATGITAYLKNGGTLENAAAMANHASPAPRSSMIGALIRSVLMRSNACEFDVRPISYTASHRILMQPRAYCIGAQADIFSSASSE